ncbi:MAG: TAXI family TRAP transporter solute-binding subunit [Synergistales bacterium]|nr:TAXI family TRAP transporter solute-binding subunit [Synergistales bacterium]
MKKATAILVTVVLLAICLVFGFSVQAEATTYRVNIATATTGGAYYPIGNAMAQIWTKKVDGVKAAAQSTAGTPQNVELMMNEEVQIALGQNGICYYAFNGTGTYEGKKGFPAKSLRGITALYPNVMHWVVASDSDIASVADLRGQKIVPGAVASATEVNTREMLSVYGLNYMQDAGEVNVKADFVGYNEAVDLLKNRQIVASHIAGGVPTAAVLDVLSTGAARLISLEEDKIIEITEKYPWYFPYTIKAGTYPKQEEDIHTIALSNILFTRADQPEELIYMLTKSIYDYHDDLVSAHKATQNTILENALNGMTLPLHPGSVKYYQEQGIDIPAKLIAQ